MGTKRGLCLLSSFFGCFALLFTLFVFAAHAKDSCPLHYLKENSFHLEPVTHTQPPQSCPEYNGKPVCCHQEYDQDIADRVDIVSSAFGKVLTNIPDECWSTLRPLSCRSCSASQATWFKQHSYGFSLEICLDFCDKLFDACGKAKLNNTKVSQLFNDGEEFCYVVFQQKGSWDSVIIDDSDDCTENLTECTTDDFVARYTACELGTESRDAFWSLKEDSHCRGGAVLPSPKKNLPCDVPCYAGEYLPVGELTCAECPPGTFSLGGGISVDEWFDWPEDLPFRTYCIQYDYFQDTSTRVHSRCGWELAKQYLFSGRINDSMDSVVELPILFVTDGYVRFDYRVSAEQLFDGLYFYIDDKVFLDKISFTVGVEQFYHDIDAGYHTLKWVYSKDFSLSQGEDMAAIISLDLSGTSYSVDSCEPCPPGTFNPNASSDRCAECPADHYADKEGSAQCTPCPPNYYAYPGSSACELREEPCTQADTTFYYTPCINNQRTKTYVFNQPLTCNPSNYELPAPKIELDCDCQPGQEPKQVTSGSGLDSTIRTICENCEAGYYSDGFTCQPCGGGFHAPRTLRFETFDSSWTTFFSTGCSGFCLSNWRLNGTQLDTGVKHGAVLLTYLSTRVSLLANAEISFNYSLFCEDDSRCQFRFAVENTLSAMLGEGTKRHDTYIVEKAGTYQVMWRFEKRYIDDPPTKINDDRALIHSIIIKNTASLGGAATCEPCPAGTAAQSLSIQCLTCPAGFYSSAKSQECIPCPANYYSVYPGSSECLPCGQGTTSLPGSSTCVDMCEFTVDEKTVYDLKKMRQDSMYGPIWDSRNEQYFINLCNVSHNNRNCLDDDGNPIPAYVCQVTTDRRGKNLGIVASYSRFDNDPKGGLVVTFTHGDKCVNIERETNLTLLCDPAAGIGQPVARDPIEDHCHYFFEWRSLYACPLCTELDYTYTYTECHKGKRTKVYMWKENPKRCHDGVSLPEDTVSDCTPSTTVCGPGKYYDPELLKCTTCPIGHYCMGGGFIMDNWAPQHLIDSGFTNLGGWEASENYKYIISGQGRSQLEATVTFARAGSVTFSYKVFGNRELGATFTFSVDGNVLNTPIYSTDYKTIDASFRIPDGTHALMWQFEKGVKASPQTAGYYAILSKITFIGTSYSEFAPVACLPGTYANTTGSSTCAKCPAGYTSRSGASQCAICDQRFTSVRGGECYQLPICGPEDFQLLYTECVNETRTAFYSKVSDCYTATDGYQPPSNYTSFECKCPQGFLPSKSRGCVGCPSGTYLNGTTCVKSTPGFAAAKKLSFFDTDTIGPGLPSSFQTDCDGECFHATGWRYRGAVVDSSPFTSGPVDSWLKVTVDFEVPGSITFEYSVVSDSGNDGLLFYIDDERSTLEYHPLDATFQKVSFDVTSGTHLFLWNFHHSATEKEGDFGLASLRNLVFSGARDGSAPEMVPCLEGSFAGPSAIWCQPCPPGTYNNQKRSATCKECGRGYFAPEEGATSCEQCGNGTMSSADFSMCVTDCIFRVNGNTFDLNPLKGLLGPLTLDVGGTTTYVLLDICDPLPNGKCLGAKDSFVCNIQTGLSGGRKLELADPASLRQRDPSASLALLYSKGSETPQCSEMSTVITFFCDEEFAAPPNWTSSDRSGMTQLLSSSSQPKQIPGTDQCSLYFQWKSFSACRRCTPDDYIERKTACEDGYQQVSRLRNGTCVGLDIVYLETRQCQKTFEFPVAAVVGFLVAFLALLIVVGVVVWRHRSLSHKYTLLQEEKSKTVELKEMDSGEMDRSRSVNNEFYP